MKLKYELYLKDIIFSIDKIYMYTKDINQVKELENDSLVKDAVVRNLEIIGEAVSQLPNDLKENYPDIPWKDIKNFRNIVVHRYWVIDVDILFDIIKNKLPILQRQIKEILEEVL